MPVDQERARAVFQKLNRQLGKLAAKAAPESVHKFRTSARRVEVILRELVAQPNRNDKKLLKLLERLRKRAGQVRDLDVQLSSLHNLKIPESARHKAQLVRALVEERARHEKKLEAVFDQQTVRELRKRLKKTARDFKITVGDPMALARRLLDKSTRGALPPTEKILHRYRIVGKRSRYLAELNGKPEAHRLVEQLKHMQDGIGDWHDWLKLTERAEKLFGGMQGVPLIAVLRNITRAKFRQAVDALPKSAADESAKKPAAMDRGTGRERTTHESAKGASAA